jgi:hypothetical protein
MVGHAMQLIEVWCLVGPWLEPLVVIDTNEGPVEVSQQDAEARSSQAGAGHWSRTLGFEHWGSWGGQYARLRQLSRSTWIPISWWCYYKTAVEAVKGGKAAAWGNQWHRNCWYSGSAESDDNSEVDTGSKSHRFLCGAGSDREGERYARRADGGRPRWRSGVLWPQRTGA